MQVTLSSIASYKGEHKSDVKAFKKREDDGRKNGYTDEKDSVENKINGTEKGRGGWLELHT